MEKYDWNWRKPLSKNKHNKEKRKRNELWNLWWPICATQIKRKTRSYSNCI